MTEAEKTEEEQLRGKKKQNDGLQIRLQDEFDAAIKLRDKLIAEIGNLVPDDVPVSEDEAFNGKIRKWGELRLNIDNKLRHHHELLYMIGGYEPERGAKVAGHRGYFLTGAGVILNMALQNYGINFLLERKYTPVYPPFFMKKSVMEKTAQLSEFDEALYHVNEISHTAAAAAAANEKNEMKENDNKFSVCYVWFVCDLVWILLIFWILTGLNGIFCILLGKIFEFSFGSVFFLVYIDLKDVFLMNF